MICRPYPNSAGRVYYFVDMVEKRDNLWWILGIAWEMGYLIALPLVGLALLGRFIDGVFGTAPLALLLGILLAIILSTIIVTRKVSELLKNIDSDTKK